MSLTEPSLLSRGTHIVIGVSGSESAGHLAGIARRGLNLSGVPAGTQRFLASVPGVETPGHSHPSLHDEDSGAVGTPENSPPVHWRESRPHSSRVRRDT